MLTVTCDVNVNIKPLKKLEREGKIRIFVVAIEGLQNNRKAPNKDLPLAVLDSPFSTLDNCRIGSDETPYHALQHAIGAQHHGDVLHLESHIFGKRDIFVTEDTDFLAIRSALKEQFGVTIMTGTELIAMFEHKAHP